MKENKLNPYPGTREFRADESDSFFGRREEIEILSGLVLARRVSLLFAQSGAGKSSLIHAGLVPELSREEEIGRGSRRRRVRKMIVLPVTGVGGGIPPRLSRPLENVYVFSALQGLFPEAEPDDLAGLDLADGIAPLLEKTDVGGKADHDEVPVLLVFDQFEELFTQHLERWRQRLVFFEQVARALDRYPGLHVLMSMREDFIAELTPFAGFLPGELRDRFRLERLRPDPALEAVRRPAERAGVPFTEGVAEELIENLRRAQAGPRRHTLPPMLTEDDATPLDEYVEPVHLQIVCRRLWEHLDEGRATIEKGDLQQLGDVDQALKDFYEEGLRDVLEETGLRVHHLRNWFEQTALITPARTRGLIYRGAEDTEGLANEMVDRLVDAYLVRATQRGGDTWYELAHDRLVEPILAANLEWRDLHLKPLTLAAEAWEETDRDPRKLYSGVLLAQTWAATEAKPEDYTKLEFEFVAASVEAEQAAARRQRIQLGVVIGVVTILMTAAAISTWFYSIAVSRELAAHSIQQIEEDPELSLLLALEALKRSTTEEAKYALRRALREPQVVHEGVEEDSSQAPSIEQNSSDESCSVRDVLKTWPFKSAALSSDGKVGVGDIHGGLSIAQAGLNCVEDLKKGRWVNAHQEPVNNVAFSDDGEFVVTASDDQTAAVWATGSGRLIARLRGHREPVLTANFGPENNSIHTSSSSGTVRRWEFALPHPSISIGAKADFIRLSPNGHRLVAILDHEARILEINSDNEPIDKLTTTGKPINDAAFSPDSNWVVIADADHVVQIKSLVDSRHLRLEGHEDEVTKVTFSRDGKWLLSSGDDDQARVWDWQREEQLASFPHESFTEAAFSPNADRVVTIVADSAKIWHLDGRDPVVLRHLNVEGASFDPAGRRVVTVSTNGTVRLWQTNGKPLEEELSLSDKALYGASFSLDGRSVVIWGRAPTAYLWKPENGKRFMELPGHDTGLGSPYFTSDSQFVLTYGSGQAQAWDTQSYYSQRVGELSLAGNGSTINALSWSADGLQLAVVLTDRWEDEWLELHACEVCRSLNELTELAWEQLRPERPLTPEERARYLNLTGPEFVRFIASQLLGPTFR